MNLKKNKMNLMLTAVAVTALWLPLTVSAEQEPEAHDGYGYTISEVVAHQRWPWERKVDIDFLLIKPAEAPIDQLVKVSVVASNDTYEVAVSDESLRGTTVFPDGYRRIVWDPTYDHSEQFFPRLKFYLSVVSTNAVPEYMIVDLASGSVEYKNVFFADEVNSDLYKTAKMAFRHIEPGTFMMGVEDSSRLEETTLTKGFYIGVFQVTQEQWKYVKGSYSGNFTTEREMRPVEYVSYHDIRGATLGTNWPAASTVDTDSFLGVLRSRTSINTLNFDLPTEAQWEYACRAGTTTYYNDGKAAAPDDSVSQDPNESNAFINVLGRYKYNGGYVWNGSEFEVPGRTIGLTNGTAAVGSYLPNAWGLYDFHGNVYEWCLDWYARDLIGGVDPVGATRGSNRVRRGGGWSDNALICRSATWGNSSAPTTKHRGIGFRLVRNLP